MVNKDTYMLGLLFTSYFLTAERSNELWAGCSSDMDYGGRNSRVPYPHETRKTDISDLGCVGRITRTV